ncbi:type II secretion system protein [Vagococcus sp. BWB3-3]|uniref:Type II secretion system protein n=1 Tax=Vagococcus allomyrinae TaxID=2794353 RepID=A0A940PF22_9ENTE|nr:type II secretion system protein [Vagococcus allomyrinae]MBP1042798.1 type II secretion system protein [Vagococcus allomyrinae]
MTNVVTLQGKKENRLNAILADERGLTMIELLATVVILAIILGIGAMAIGQVIQNSREDATISEVKNAYQAAKLYLASTEGAKAAQTSGSFTFKAVVDAKHFEPQTNNWDTAKYASVKFYVKDGQLSLFIPKGALKAGTAISTKDIGADTQVGSLTQNQVLDLARSAAFG